MSAGLGSRVPPCSSILRAQQQFCFPLSFSLCVLTEALSAHVLKVIPGKFRFNSPSLCCAVCLIFYVVFLLCFLLDWLDLFLAYFFLSTRLKVICLSKLKIIHFPHETPAPLGRSPCNPALRGTAASMLTLLLSVRPTGHPVAWFSGCSFGSLPAASPSCMVPPTRPGPFPGCAHTDLSWEV